MGSGYGYQWLLTKISDSSPKLFHTPPNKQKQSKIITLTAIQHLLNIGATKHVPKDQQNSGIYLVFFVARKKNGDTRAILDLR